MDNTVVAVKKLRTMILVWAFLFPITLCMWCFSRESCHTCGKDSSWLLCWHLSCISLALFLAFYSPPPKNEREKKIWGKLSAIDFICWCSIGALNKELKIDYHNPETTCDARIFLLKYSFKTLTNAIPASWWGSTLNTSRWQYQISSIRPRITMWFDPMLAEQAHLLWELWPEDEWVEWLHRSYKSTNGGAHKVHVVCGGPEVIGNKGSVIPALL